MNNEKMKNSLKECSKEISKIRDMLDIEKLSLRVDALESLKDDDGFWDDTDNASKTLEEINSTKMIIDEYLKLKYSLDDMDVKVQMNELKETKEFDNEFDTFLKDFKLKLLDLNLKV